MDTPGKIYKAIPAIMIEMEAIGKDQKNTAQGFKFRGIDDVYNALQKVMAKHGVFTVPEIIGRSKDRYQNSKGTPVIHIINNFKWRFYADDGSFIEAWSDGEAIDFGDKASSKAASIAHKYALLEVFCIPTEEIKDPDHDSPKIPQRDLMTLEDLDKIRSYALSKNTDFNFLNILFKDKTGRPLHESFKDEKKLILELITSLTKEEKNDK